MKKLIFIISILLVLFSCKTKQKITENTVEKIIVKDSIIYKDRIVIKPGIKDTIKIQSPCDSVGQLKPVYAKIKSNNGVVTIKNVDGDLDITVDIKESVDSSSTTLNSTDKQHFVKEVKSNVTVKYVWTKWTYILLIIAVLEFFIIIKGGPKKTLDFLLKLFI